MLSELRDIHETLLSKITEIHEYLSCTNPARCKLAKIRMELSRASQNRHRYLSTVIYPHIEQHACNVEKQRLRNLRQESATLSASTSAHVGKWTIDLIMHDWENYRSACSTMRRLIENQVRAEAMIVYPLLEKYEAAVPVRYYDSRGPVVLPRGSDPV